MSAGLEPPDGQGNDAAERSRILLYHQASKHSSRGYAPSPGFLDWDSQPDPFRTFEQTRRIALPLNRRVQAAGFHQLHRDALPSLSFSASTIGLLCELAWGLSAWKAADGARWALRCVPSSGNLHPTETYLLLWEESVGLPAGVYHYHPLDHALECRAELGEWQVQALRHAYPDHVGMAGLSSIGWREEWKYGSRAFRYCQLDVGHAVGSLAYAARVCGWGAVVDPRLTDDDIEALLGLSDRDSYADRERERPDVLIWLERSGQQALPPDLAPLRAVTGTVNWQGRASQVSREMIVWPEVALAESVTRKTVEVPVCWPEPRCLPVDPPPEHDCPADRLIRQRRSAQRMDPAGTMHAADFRRLLGRVLPGVERWSPLCALPFQPAIQLMFLVHGVEGFAPGAYLLDRGLPDWSQWSAGRPWQAADPHLPLYGLPEAQDLRRLASQMSCYQGIAGRGAVTVVMVADMAETLAREGAWAYRRLHWEAGLLGQILYLEAEASGLRGTGIGCFMDDDSVALSGLRGGADGRWQTVYHFTIGAAIDDPRLQSEPAYPVAVSLDGPAQEG